MAKKATGDKGGKKAARKRGEDRNSTPALVCPQVANATRPHTTESSGVMATKLPDFLEAVKTWTAAVRKAFVEKVDLPIFPAGKFLNLNAGQMSRKAAEALVEAYNESETPGSVDFPPRYNPVFVDAIHASNAVTLRRGSPLLHPAPPKDWDEKLYGDWWHEYKDEDGKVCKEPSGWFFDVEKPRRCHAVTAESLIDDPDKNILTFGSSRYVVGTGSHDKAAAFMVWQTERGNYRHGDEARKRMSLAGNALVRDVIFKIEDRPNNGGGVTIKGEWIDVREMVFMPGQVLTAGNLYDSKSKQLSAKDIRALDGNTKGLKFKALAEPIVGKVVPWPKIWDEIRVSGKDGLKKMRERDGRSEDHKVGSLETRSITNLLVNGKRVDPSEATPFGLKGGQIHMPAHLVATGEGKVEGGHFGMGVVIGERANSARSVGVVEARKELAPAGAEAPEPKVKAKVEPKAKKATKKTEPKAKKAAKKATKKTEPKVKAKAEPKKAEPKKATKPSDAAPPVESNTADDPEPVMAENEVEVVGAGIED